MEQTQLCVDNLPMLRALGPQTLHPLGHQSNQPEKGAKSGVENSS